MKKQKEGFSAQTAQNFGCCFRVALVYFSPVNFQDSCCTHTLSSFLMTHPAFHKMFQGPCCRHLNGLRTPWPWETLIFLTVIGALTHSLVTVGSFRLELSPSLSTNITILM